MSRIMRGILFIFIPIFWLEAAHFLPEFLRFDGKSSVIGKYAEQEQSLKRYNDDLAQALSVAPSVEETKKQIALIATQSQILAQKKIHAKSEGERSFIRKKESLLTELSNALGDLQKNHEQYVQTLKAAIENLKLFLSNPQFDAGRIPDKDSYTFAEFQQTATQLLSAQQELDRAVRDKKHVNDELQKNGQLLAQLERDAQRKEDERRAFLASKKPMDAQEREQKSELLDLEIQIVRRHAESTALAQRELTVRRENAQLDATVATTKVAVYKHDVAQVERRLWVHTLDIQAAQIAVDEKKREIDEKLAGIDGHIQTLNAQYEIANKQFEKLNNSLEQPIKDTQKLQEWRFDPATEADAVGCYKAAAAFEMADTIARELMLFRAQADALKYQLVAAELNVEILKTWLAIVQRTLMRDDTVHQERLTYFASKRAEFDQALTNYANQRKMTEQLMSIETRANSRIKQIMQESGVPDYVRKELLPTLDDADKAVDLQLDINGQLLKVYAGIGAQLSDLRHRVEMMLYKLESAEGIWQRTASAITWEGVKSTVSDVRFFFEEIANLISRATVTDVITWFSLLFHDPLALLNILFVLMALVLLYVLLLFGLPLVSKLLRAGAQSHGLQLVTNFFATIIDFCRTYLFGILAWSILFYLIRFDALVGVGSRTKLVFYLLSIVYVCFLIRACVRYYAEHNVALMEDPFYRRFMWVLRFFVFVTVVIYFVREAFLAVSYGYSELPTLLLAMYSIITRISLIMLLMAKDVVLDALPQHGNFWGFVREYLERYYTLVLLVVVVLIVMSDPFVGYSRLVATVVQSSLLTVLLFAGLWLLQNVFKHYSSMLFFETRDETVRDRFAYATTWYALFIVLSFVVVILLAIGMLAKIWGYSTSFESIIKFFNVEIARVPGEIAGQTTPITLGSLGVFVAFIFGGFFIASLFARYVLARIYQLLQIDVGIKNTVSRISTYIIVALILIIGLQQIGLGGWIPVAIGLFAFGVAWAIREPANDFIAYFIILVERSVKIGDYIRLTSSESDQTGFVRKITPRSVILRKKNSYNIIIPNSQVTRSVLYNWNYAGQYFAFDDIKFAVTYDSDPEKVKRIVLEILDKNADVLKNPSPIIRLNHFGINGLEMVVRAFLSLQHVGDQWNIRSDIRFAMVKEFTKNNIKFAVQTYDVTLNREL